MRVAVLLLALAGLATTTPPAAAADPAGAPVAVKELPDHALAIGDPDAATLLTEYLSYTCPHCAHYAEESEDELGAMVRAGGVRVELVPAVRDPLDMAAAMLARCVPADRFLTFHHDVFAEQAALDAKARTVGGMYSRVPVMTNADVIAVAEASGLDVIAARAGLDQAGVAACLADRQTLDELRGTATAAWAKIRGTPSFAINGRLTPAGGWADVKTALAAAGAE